MSSSPLPPIWNTFLSHPTIPPSPPFCSTALDTTTVKSLETDLYLKCSSDQHLGVDIGFPTLHSDRTSRSGSDGYPELPELSPNNGSPSPLPTLSSGHHPGLSTALFQLTAQSSALGNQLYSNNIQLTRTEAMMYGITEIFNGVEKLKQQDLAEREKMKEYWDRKNDQLDGLIAHMQGNEQQDDIWKKTVLDTIIDLKMQLQQMEQRIHDLKQAPVQQEGAKDTKAEVEITVIETIRQLQRNGLLAVATPHPFLSISPATIDGSEIADSAPNCVYIPSPELGGNWSQPIKGTSFLSQSRSPKIAPQVTSISSPMQQNSTPSPKLQKRTLLSSPETDEDKQHTKKKVVAKYMTAPQQSLSDLPRAIKTAIRHESSVLRSDLAASKAPKRRLLDTQSDAGDLTQQSQPQKKPTPVRDVGPGRVDTRWDQKKRRLLDSQSDNE